MGEVGQLNKETSKIPYEVLKLSIRDLKHLHDLN